MRKVKGFTLLEMILVLILLSGIFLFIINYQRQRLLNNTVDLVVSQVQQILNAALAYYTVYGQWPLAANASCEQTTLCTKNCNCSSPLTLQNAGYLPNPLPLPWGYPIFMAYVGKYLGPSNYLYNNQFGVYFWASSPLMAKMIVSRLANAKYVSPTEVIIIINPPTQNLNSARAVNFANIYHPAACVPVPQCTTGGYTQNNQQTTYNMKPQIYLIPVSVSGNYGTSGAYYPITGVNAYAIGPFSWSGNNGVPYDSANKPCITGGIQDCYTSCRASGCVATSTNALSKGQYWRVCLSVQTTAGEVVSSTSNAANNVAILAITSCVAANEPTGSDFTVYTQ